MKFGDFSLVVVLGFLLQVQGNVVKTGDASHHFDQFVATFDKHYETTKELDHRRSIFLENYEQMLSHNARYEAGEVTWFQKVNEYMDQTAEELTKKREIQLYGLHSLNTTPMDQLDSRIQAKLDQIKEIPDEFDWVSQGKVSVAKDQGQCGSCAAFSALAAVESCFKILEDDSGSYDLSEQHILDCGYGHTYYDEDGNPWSAFGCFGAWPQAYFDWLSQPNQLTQNEPGYPYVSGNIGDVKDCSPVDNNYNKHAMVTGQWNKWDTKEDDMKSVVLINPVSTSVMMTYNWNNYGGGIMEDWHCCDSKFDIYCVNRINHAILVVGYGHDEESGLDYWLIKNSWGASWGENGFMKLKRGTGHCAVGYKHQTIPHCSLA